MRLINGQKTTVLSWAWSTDVLLYEPVLWWRAYAIISRRMRTGACTFNAYTMAARSCLCRLCQSSVPSAHAVCLFGPTAVRQSLPSRISDLLDVPVVENDGFPEHICEKCKRRLERLEKAAEDLENFTSQAKSSYTTLCTCRRGELRETSSSVGDPLPKDVSHRNAWILIKVRTTIIIHELKNTFVTIMLSRNAVTWMLFYRDLFGHLL